MPYTALIHSTLLAFATVSSWGLLQKSLSSNSGAGPTPTPQEKIAFVGWASCPSGAIFARGLLNNGAKMKFVKSQLPLSKALQLTKSGAKSQNPKS